MTAPVRLPCPCRTKQEPVLWRRATMKRLAALRCPTCGRVGFLRAAERVVDGWNEALEQERLRVRDVAKGRA